MSRRQLILWIFLHATCCLHAQDSLRARKGYNAFERPGIEDNSFLIEEAFNQGMGVLQHIFTTGVEQFGSNEIAHTFSQEIPLTDEGHQIGYTINYLSLFEEDSAHFGKSGMGELLVHYRPRLLTGHDWCMLIPRFSFIIPAGNAMNGFGDGAFGWEVNLAATKRLTRKTVMHANLGRSQRYRSKEFGWVNDERKLMRQFDKVCYTLGLSGVWLIHQRANFLVETLAIHESGAWRQVINPGARFSLSVNRMQVVPGVCWPISIERNPAIGMMFYLSFEPDYEQFFRRGR